MQNMNDIYYIKDIVSIFLSDYENIFNCDSFAVYKENKKMPRYYVDEKSYIFVFKKNKIIYEQDYHKSMICFHIKFDYFFNFIEILYSPSLFRYINKIKFKMNKKFFLPNNLRIVYKELSFYNKDMFKSKYIKKLAEFYLKT